LFGVCTPGVEGFDTSVPFGFGFGPPRSSLLMDGDNTPGIGQRPFTD
jgi:hypothetical protein